MRRAGPFSRFAQGAARAAGRPASFALAVAVLVVWAATGPRVHFSDTWQLVINTGTTIITFLMVFLIQHTQNRDSLAVHIKLDEILRSIHEASNELLDLEDLDERDLDTLRRDYARLARLAMARSGGRTKPTSEDEHEPTAAAKP